MAKANKRHAIAPSPLKATERRWRAVAERDGRLDGTFFYAVKTSGVYCRPACPSRRPNPENVTFYETPDDAEQAGFRACLRCRPRLALPRRDTLQS